MRRIDWGTLTLAVAAIAITVWGVLCTSGCASRAQIEEGLTAAEAESAALDAEIERLQAIKDAIAADLADEEPGSPGHEELSGVLDEAQRGIDLVRNVKAGVDDRIAGYRAELAEIPPDAADWQVTGRLAGKALKDESENLPYPWNIIAWGVGAAVTGVSTVGWVRNRRAVVEVVHGFEDGKRYNDDLGEAMDAASPMIRAAQSPGTKKIVAKIRKGA